MDNRWLTVGQYVLKTETIEGVQIAGENVLVHCRNPALSTLHFRTETPEGQQILKWLGQEGAIETTAFSGTQAAFSSPGANYQTTR